MRYLRSALILLATTLALAAPAVWAAESPFNGSFELVNMGEPLGWTVRGPWFVRADAALLGRNGVHLRPEYSRAGDRLVPTGYLLVSTGETITLSFHYTCSAGKPEVGLIYCDPFGRPVGEGETEILPEAMNWTRYDKTVTLTPELCAQPYAAVRVIFLAGTDGTGFRLDDVKLSRPHSELPRPMAPKIKAELRPNLLSNPALKLAPDGTLPGWTAVDTPGFARDNARLLTVDGSSNAKLALFGAPKPVPPVEMPPEAAPAAPAAEEKPAETAPAAPTAEEKPAETAPVAPAAAPEPEPQPAAWLSSPVLLDGGLPYVLKATVDTADLCGGTAWLVLRVVDPQDPDSIWLQQMQALEPSGGTREAVEPLARLYTQSTPMMVQVALAVGVEAVGSVTASALSLQPEPLSVAVRSAAVYGGFQKPKDVSLFISAVNNTYASLKPKATMTVVTKAGAAVTSENRAIVIGSRSAAYFPYKPKLVHAGEYVLTVRIVDGTKELGACRYEFSVAGE